MGRTSLGDVVRRLSERSVQRAYDPYRELEWPDELPAGRRWMSADLLSPFGTPRMAELGEAALCRLSRWELVNFFSFNVHGIRELMLHVLGCIHRAEHEEVSEYFHHFLDEENKHMWFFAEFCKRYGGKIYATQKLQFSAFEDPDVQSFIAFAKILISEQISDFYNLRMMADESLPEIVRTINLLHHEDESRHIAMGLRLVSHLYEDLAARHSADTRRRVESYLSRYMRFFVESFYNPSAYRDTGLAEPHRWRRELLEAPERRAFHARVLARPARFFRGLGMDVAEAA